MKKFRHIMYALDDLFLYIAGGTIINAVLSIAMVFMYEYLVVAKEYCNVMCEVHLVVSVYGAAVCWFILLAGFANDFYEKHGVSVDD